jgi:two-component system cell cycle response regulator
MDNYKISFLGEFVDKSMESEYLAHSMSSFSKSTGFIASIFGVIFMLFLGSDYYVLESTSSLIIVTLTRLLFFIISIAVFFVTRKTMKYTNFIYLITVYQALVAIAYLVILEQYDSLNYFSVLGLMVISLAIYILPKIMFSQIISIIFSILFFLYPAQMIEGLEKFDFFKIIAYQVLLLIYCNVNACLNNSYKRKQFAASRELLALSVTDPLTGIYNRAKFDEELNRWVNLANRYGNPLSLILFDIDDFKKVNDSLGHLAGDNVIKKIVATTKKSIRNTDIFARWGGEEFVILLPNTDIRQARDLAERMRLCLPNNSYEPEKKITCSYGIATLEKGDTAQSLLRKADILLLKAKASGKDNVISQ